MALKPTGAGAQAELATLSEGELLAVVRAQPRPEHVAIIMDGNGRWATRRGLPRVAGHREGVKTARAIVRAADTLGLRYLTLYAFSTENWSRPEDEVSTLLSLLERAIRSELPELMERNVRLRVLGRKNGVPLQVRRGIDHVVHATRDNTGLGLMMAFNYGGRDELIDACRALARRVQAGELRPEDIGETEIQRALYTADVPDPDLLIRTSGEMRVSNFLLRQIAYTELLITPTLWPDVVVSALVGGVGLLPTMAAILAGRTVALANKETLVVAGSLMTAAARARGVKLLPVDSEHSAVFQCLAGHNRADVHRILLTASGGPFRETPKAQLATMTVEDALKHPTWKMGAKITIDSATLMNKGLEIIEARWLFDVAPDQVQVVVHPQSIVHSMVEYLDGSVIAQLGVADMGVPILYALTYPERRPTPAARLDLTRVGQLTFYEPDTDKFPCLRLAREALEHGGGAPVVLNAANEVAVAAFLDRRIGLTEIARLIEWALDDARPGAARSLEECVAIDAEPRRRGPRRIDARGGGRAA